MENSPAPPEWADDEKMSVLFAPFRESRDVNPNSWDRKLDFWSRFIMQKYQLMGKAAFNGIELPSQFERKGKVPFCLGIVVQNMINKGQLQTLIDFQAGADRSWMSWSFNFFVKKPVSLTFNWFVKKPLSWTYKKLISGDSSTVGSNTGIGESTQKLNNQDYVIIDVVKALGEKIVGHHYATVKSPQTDTVRGLEQLRAECQKICPEGKSFELALLWLCKQKRCIIQDTEHGKVVVFAAQNQTTVKELTPDELRIYSLKNTEEKLNQEIALISNEMEKCRKEAKVYLQKGMKSSAKNCLRQKKRLESQQEKKELALDNLHQLMISIEQAHGDRQVLDAYSSGVEAFKSFRKTHGLSAEAVDDVMIGVQQVLDDQDEMNRSISSPVVSDMYGDDLEAELEGILGEDQPIRVGDLPAVPSGAVRVKPHQDVIDSLCQMRLADDDLPEIPTHSPGSPVGFDLPSPPKQLPRDSPSRVALLDVATKISPNRSTKESSPVRWNSPQQEIPPGNRQTWGSPIRGDQFANYSIDGASNYSPNMQDSYEPSQNSPSNLSWGLPTVPSESPWGNPTTKTKDSQNEEGRQRAWMFS